MIDELLRSEALTVAFQPIIHLQSGTVFAHEVLGRVHPTPGSDPALGPAALLDLAVDQGRLMDVEHRWRSIAIAAIARSRAPGLFFLNVDTRILDDPRFRPGTTSRLLEKYRLQRSRFVFEITERDPALHARRLSQLLGHYSAQGYGIALDDLGVGHSSLHVLVQLRPRIIKLDRELCSGVSRDPMRLALVDSLLSFATRTNLCVVAEGIEERDDLAELMKLGVQYGQGFLLGRPGAEPLGSSVRRLPLARSDFPPPLSREAG